MAVVVQNKPCRQKGGDGPETASCAWPEAQEVPVVCVTGSSLLR